MSFLHFEAHGCCMDILFYNCCMDSKWKHTMGGPKMLSHCTILQRCPCLNFNHDILEHIFPNFLHNMVCHNTKKSIKKKIHFFNLHCAIPKYICDKKKMSLCTKKWKYIQKMIEMIFSLYKFIISIKHCDSIWLE